MTGRVSLLALLFVAGCAQTPATAPPQAMPLLPLPAPARAPIVETPSACPLGQVLRRVRVRHGTYQTARCIPLDRQVRGAVPLEDPINVACKELVVAERGKPPLDKPAPAVVFCDDTKRYHSGDPEADARWIHGETKALSR